MFLPIGDDQDHERRPYVTWILIAANIAAFFLFCLPLKPERIASAAFIPAHLRPLSIFTSLFLHADLFHLAGNMLFLWIFGRMVEERIGSVAYALFYPVCGVAAAFLHAYATEHPEIPAFGASGAVSGAVGAALLLAPRAQIKVFVWFIVWGVYEIPAAIWIALWFAEQVYFSSRDYGNVAYYAHLGGFAAGAATAWVLRFAAGLVKGRRGPPLESKDLAEPRRPFLEVRAEAAPAYVDPSIDSYAVVTLEDAAAHAARISEIAGAAHSIEATHGVVARRMPREAADRLRKSLQEAGIASALVADVPANHPPSPGLAESVSWDDRVLRLRLGNQSVPVPWSAPFLFVAAAVETAPFLDLFVGPTSAFRIRQSPTIAVTRIDVRRRSEEASDLAGLARDILQRRPAAGNAGLRLLAEGRDLGWLAFRTPADYDDYLFWTYNLALSKTSSPGA